MDRTISHPWRRAARLATATAIAFGLSVSACGGATAEQPAATAAVAKATVGTTTATTTPTSPSPAAVALNVQASASGSSLLLKADQIAVPAGDVKITFKNTDPKMDHELWVYPVQDVTKLLAARRAGEDADEDKFLQDSAGSSDSVAPGGSKDFIVSLKPGFYELACFEQMKNADGSTVVHFDKGQTATLAVIGAGGPAASIATAASSLNVAMKDGAYGSWVLIPDHLVATAGQVTVNVTNNMKINHDFVVYPIGDVSAQIAEGLKAGEDIDLDIAQPIAEDLEPGKTATKTIALTPGTYVMACFMVSKNADGSTFVHRDMGQRITFVVK
ncbi:MAG TPA: hypothetical protein VI814_02560 [Candidatus Limnocylindria bacterium]